MGIRREMKEWKRRSINHAENRTLTRVLLRQYREVAGDASRWWWNRAIARLGLRTLTWIDRVESWMEKVIRDRRRSLRDDYQDGWWRE